MKLSKLIPLEWLEGRPPADVAQDMEGRCTGNSTGICLEVIGKAMQRVSFGRVARSARFEYKRIADYHMELTRRLIKRLGLKYLKVEVIDNCVVVNYDILREVHPVTTYKEV